MKHNPETDTTISKQQSRVARKAAVKRMARAVQMAATNTERIVEKRRSENKKSSKAKWLSQLRDIFSEAQISAGTHIGTVLAEHEKRNARNELLCASWNTSDSGTLIAEYTIYKKKWEDRICYKPILVSDHALERVIERTCELDINKVLKELAPPIFSMMLVLTLATDHLEEEPMHGEHFAIPSPNGIAIAVVDKESGVYSVAIKTWLSFAFVRRSPSLRHLYDGHYERLDRMHKDKNGLFMSKYDVNCIGVPVLTPRRIHEGDYAWQKIIE
jgi:hypothetical protein